MVRPVEPGRKLSFDPSARLMLARRAASASVRAPPQLRPTGTRCGSLDGEHLARARRIRPPARRGILRGQQKERLPIGATQHAGEAAAVEIDGLHYLAAFADAHTTFG